MRITALLSCLTTALTEVQRAAINARGIEWMPHNRRLGRVLLDSHGWLGWAPHTDQDED